MKINMAKVDRWIRVVAGAVLLFLDVAGIVTGPFAMLLWVMACLLLLTGVAGSCPFYSWFGIRSLRTGRTIHNRRSKKMVH